MYQRQVSFTEAIKKALTQNYCNFEGRSSRSEYWWYVLFTCIISVIVTAIFTKNQETATIVNGIIGLALLLPGLGLSVRRLHDINKSGWWLLIGLLPIVGAILIIIWMCTGSQMSSNEYGPVPNME